MPRVKIDYVVSFSSEDPENQASNLLSWEVNKRRWLCARGEPAASAVLQLARAVTISSVQIGAHQAALVEVLVARSESPTEPFQVLVPSSVFLSPRESRGAAGVAGGAGADRVRSFEGVALAEGARAQRWDRVRLVCSQPYNKHCKYGISFIHIFEPEGAPDSAPVPAPAVPPRMLALDTVSSDEDEFRPGELFAKHRQSAPDTGAQIREATSLALRNNPDACTKLMKTPLSKNKATASTDRTQLRGTHRDKDNLMYTTDDERPHAKIDHIVQKHRDEKSKQEANTLKLKEQERDKVDKTPCSKREEPSGSRRSEGRQDRDRSDRGKERTSGERQPDRSEASSGKGMDESRKRSYTGRDARSSSAAERPLRGVVFVLSGYANPERARLRELGLALGARYERDWGPACTHLICAFANTPKLRAVRGGPGGARAAFVRGAWLEACARAACRVPCRAYAVDDCDECDTDDEIEKALRQREAPRAASPTPRRAPPPPTVRDAMKPSDDDVEFVKDERMQGNITIEESEAEAEASPDERDTDVEEAGIRERISAAATLPALFEGRSFVLSEPLLAPLDVPLLARYCVAYGGLVLAASDVDSESNSHYELCASLPPASASASASGPRRLRAAWVWACHAARALLPLEDYM